MLELITNVNNALNSFIWGVPAMVCIIGVGLYLSLRTGFIQVRKFGYALKCFGFFKEGDHKFISRIILNITLPASIVCGMTNFESDNQLFLLILLGLACSVIPLLIGYAITLHKKDDKPLRALTMINMAGYNIGCFALPFVEWESIAITGFSPTKERKLLALLSAIEASSEAFGSWLRPQSAKRNVPFSPNSQFGTSIMKKPDTNSVPGAVFKI